MFIRSSAAGRFHSLFLFPNAVSTVHQRRLGVCRRGVFLFLTTFARFENVKNHSTVLYSSNYCSLRESISYYNRVILFGDEILISTSSAGGRKRFMISRICRCKTHVSFARLQNNYCRAHVVVLLVIYVYIGQVGGRHTGSSQRVNIKDKKLQLYTVYFIRTSRVSLSIPPNLQPWRARVVVCFT